MESGREKMGERSGEVRVMLSLIAQCEEKCCTVHNYEDDNYTYEIGKVAVGGWKDEI